MSTALRTRHPMLVLGVATAAAIAGAVALGARSSSMAKAEGAARSEARAFLARYVDQSGRVVRRDQGGDTVSEGQAYALLLAQVAGDRPAFRRVWRWTRAHLQTHDGLLSYLYKGGAVRDASPASDADLLAAWALLRARGDGARAYRRAGRRLAAAVLARETAHPGGRLALAAGPWATGTPVTLNPSYWAPHVMVQLAHMTHDQRWSQLAATSVDFTRGLAGRGRLLPPDWARIDGTRTTPTPAPDGSAPRVQYGPDAARIVVWLASSCGAQARRLAAGWWRTLSHPARSRALSMTQQGTIVNPTSHPLPYVAAAAAASAAGDGAARDSLLARAAAADAKAPTYYGSAWLALGRALLTTRLLGGCARGGAAA
jgi:endo-1,4-beta-D-glucanase Y